MFGPGHPQYPPQRPPHYPPQPPQYPPQPPPYYPPPPPQRPKPGLSPVAIVLIVVGGLFAFGMGALVVLGGVAYLVATAEPEGTAVETAPSGVPTAGGVSPVLPRSTSTPLRPDQEADQAAGEGPSSGERAAGEAPSPADDEAGEAPAAGRTPTSPSEGSSNGAPSNGSATGAASWWCTASASVRVCGFAGACNYQMVFGNGQGKDRFLASQQAKHACETSARIKGATAVCIVQCSPR
ncbi:hypothetical protein [Sorangium sp. So ce1000]|uniref:hypothetical protein n=1 Tax=Sorangium sp. So ce1000 TaxID=3133325 RepID=UPI003F60FF01